jgi:FtsP/CotA-like multicopper oxidase with cupredoxin domain
MSDLKRISRRDFLKLTGLGAAGVFLSACGLRPSASAVPTTAPVRPTQLITLPDLPPVSVELTAERGTLPIFVGKETTILRYRALVKEGGGNFIQTLSGSYLGPIFRVKRGQRVQVRLNNELPAPTNIHWHGLIVPEKMDGHPRDVIAPGAKYDYDFQVINRSGMYWFHPHPHQLTGRQVYYGLAGLFIVSDEEEAALGLPSGEYDLPLVIQDRTFDSQNQLVYLANGMMDSMIGFLGDTIMVNGAPNASIEVKASAYRLRLLNGSNSRVYKLAWKDGTPLTVIATDGGLLEKPVTRKYITLGPGERVELWADFGKNVGSEMKLVSLPFTDFSGGMMHGGMMGGGMMGGTGLPNGAPLDIVRLRIGEKGADVVPLPSRLSTMARYDVNDAVNRNNPRSFRLAMQDMVHTINDRLFEMDAVAQDEIVQLGDLEIWEFVNAEGGGGGMDMGMGMMNMNMDMPHPMHIHGVQFQVFERQIARGYESAYQELSEGFVDDGWKDTVLVLPGETVRVLVRFENYTGTYLYHCHNLEHEDAGMMRNYRVEG